MSMGAQGGQGAWTKLTHCQDSELGLARRLSFLHHATSQQVGAFACTLGLERGTLDLEH